MGRHQNVQAAGDGARLPRNACVEDSGTGFRAEVASSRHASPIMGKADGNEAPELVAAFVASSAVKPWMVDFSIESSKRGAN